MARLLAKWLDGYRNGQVSGDCSQHFQGRGDIESTATPRQKIETPGHMGVSVVIGVPQNGWFLYIYIYIWKIPSRNGWFCGTPVSGNLCINIIYKLLETLCGILLGMAILATPVTGQCFYGNSSLACGKMVGECWWFTHIFPKNWLKTRVPWWTANLLGNGCLFPGVWCHRFNLQMLCFWKCLCSNCFTVTQDSVQLWCCALTSMKTWRQHLAQDQSVPGPQQAQDTPW